MRYLYFNLLYVEFSEIDFLVYFPTVLILFMFILVWRVLSKKSYHRVRSALSDAGFHNPRRRMWRWIGLSQLDCVKAGVVDVSGLHLLADVALSITPLLLLLVRPPLFVPLRPIDDSTLFPFIPEIGRQLPLPHDPHTLTHTYTHTRIHTHTHTQNVSNS